MQNVADKINANALIVGSDSLEKKLALMDSTNSSDRETAINAIEILIKRYILPAMDDCPASTDRFHLFDLEAITKAEFRGLVRGLFNERMSELEQPSDKQLRDALEYVGAPITDIKQREIFFRCWVGEEADSSAHSLIKFLEKPLIGVNPTKIEGVRHEQVRITNILTNKLPGGLEFALESFRERLNRGL